MKLVSLSVLHAGRLYPQEMFLVLISVRGWVNIGNRSRDLSVCSAVPQPLRHHFKVHWYWQYFSRVLSQHSHLSHCVSVCVSLLNLCVLVCVCIRDCLLIGPAMLMMGINKFLNNIIFIIFIITVVLPNVAYKWLGLLFGKCCVQI
jgi:hypothetical protein